MKGKDKKGHLAIVDGSVDEEGPEKPEAEPWVSKASLDCKAGEVKHLLPALVPVVEKLVEGTTGISEQKMLTAARENLVQLWCDAGAFSTIREFANAMSLRKDFLDAYKWLHAWSLEKGRNRFSIVARHQTFRIANIRTLPSICASWVRIMWGTSPQCEFGVLHQAHTEGCTGFWSTSCCLGRWTRTT